RSSGSLRLDDATVAFVKRFKFKPAISNGAPTPCTNEIMLRWSRQDMQASDPQFEELLGNAVHPAKDQFPPGAAARGEGGTAIGGLWIGTGGTVDAVVLVRPTQYADLNEAS